MTRVNLSIDSVSRIFDKEYAGSADQFPFYPLNSPGMPEPGFHFMQHAAALAGAADNPLQTQEWFLKYLYLRSLWDPTKRMFPVAVNGNTEYTALVPGHMWDSSDYGPMLPPSDYDKPRVMIVGKMPTSDDFEQLRNLSGAAGDVVKDILANNGVPPAEYAWWYVCNIVRWPQLNPQSGALSQKWVKDCLPLFHQEVRLWQPDYILCFGAEASKAVCGKANTLKSMAGRWVSLDFQRNLPGEDSVIHTAKAMAIMSPSAVLRSTEKLPQFESSLKKFLQLVRGVDFMKAADYDIQVVTDAEKLAGFIDEALSQPGIKKISVDAEWNGDHPGESNAYVRTVQFAYKDNHAVVVVFNEAGGVPVFKPNTGDAIFLLDFLLNRDDVQIRGSFFSADLPWFEYMGIDIAKRFTVPPRVSDLNNGNYAGGFDVALAMHAFDETGELKLENMCSRYCDMARWDNELREWLSGFATERGLSADAVEGFGECPGSILYPYGGKDVIGTHKLAELEQTELLNADRYGNSSWVPFHTSMLAFPAFNEMHTIGMKVDYERIDNLTDTFMEVRDQKLDEFRHEIKWPEFNPRSPHHCRELLFGMAYTGKIDEEGKPVSVAPEGAFCLDLKPVKTTGTRGKLWADVVRYKEEHKYSASTDKETLGILGLYNATALKLRDIRLIDQVLKSVFRAPVVITDGELAGNIKLNDKGHRVYDGGVASYITHDGRLRSWFLQTMETGRASSSRPPLQNLSKRREDDYARIIGEDHRYPVRSFITSNLDANYMSDISGVIGEKTVLVEADYTGAELLSIAIMSRSKTMIDHCLRSNLPEDDPAHYDLHSHVAVETFNLDCPPTKKGLAEAGYKGKRVGAKNVIFGGNYGRSAEAIARQCKEEGVEITVEEVKEVMDNLYSRYSAIPALQSKLRHRVAEEGWIRSCMGRLRRFIPSRDLQVMGDLERQALNFPFQSHVADAVSCALYNLMEYEDKETLGYKVVLTIHDAIVLEVPLRSVDAVVDRVLPDCMVAGVPFLASDCDGNAYPDSPVYHFGIDTDVQAYWGVPLTKKGCNNLGLDERYGK